MICISLLLRRTLFLPHLARSVPDVEGHHIFFSGLFAITSILQTQQERPSEGHVEYEVREKNPI